MKQKKSLESRDSRTQRRWLACVSKTSKFSHRDCFNELKYCHWKESKNKDTRVGDIVYIYLYNESRIVYKTYIEEKNIDLPPEELDDYRFWDKTPEKTICMKLSLLQIVEDDKLDKSHLEKHGFNRNNHRNWVCNNTELLDYIEACFYGSEMENQGIDEDYIGEDSKEGKPKKVYVSRYERDPKLRMQCIEAHNNSYKCDICGFSFEQYNCGVNFIHIHHIIPLSLIEELPDYKFKIDDLIPICPNCHAMVHRMLSKNKAKTEDACREVIDEIKNLVKQNRNGKEN